MICVLFGGGEFSTAVSNTQLYVLLIEKYNGLWFLYRLVTFWLCCQNLLLVYRQPFFR